MSKIRLHSGVHTHSTICKTNIHKHSAKTDNCYNLSMDFFFPKIIDDSNIDEIVTKCIQTFNCNGKKNFSWPPVVNLKCIKQLICKI